MTPDPSPFMVLPFATLLPLFLSHHWERHYRKISAGLGAVVVFYYIFLLNAGTEMLHVGADYVSFMVVIGSLFVVCGGVHIRVKGEGKPWVNCVYLLVGTLLGSVIGTTGASMLLVRPWIRLNKYRFTGYHLAFFIWSATSAERSRRSPRRFSWAI
jgi:Na+/H+ antiporter NhaD/arsenite permease-like protein